MRRTITSLETGCPAAEITLPTVAVPGGWGHHRNKHPPVQNSFSEQSWHNSLFFGVGDRVTHPSAGGCSGRGRWLVGGTGLGLGGGSAWGRMGLSSGRAGMRWHVGRCGDSHTMCDEDLVLGLEAVPPEEGDQGRDISALCEAF